MTTFTDIFGGAMLEAAEVSLREVALSANIVTVWPPYATSGNSLANIMQVTPTGGGFSIALPEATLASNGVGAIFTNLGASTYSVVDSTLGAVATIAAGACKFVYLDDNSTAAGTWQIITLGVGTSSPDASALAGLGLKAIGSTLNVAFPTEEKSASWTVTAGDRATPFVWTGGAGVATLPLSSTVSDDFFFEVRNQGTGVLTLTPDASELIDDSVSIALQLGESCFVLSGPGYWYTVGRGRNTQFNFTQLVKAVTGGTYTLSLTEAANVVQTFTGTLTSNVVIVEPGVVQVYYIRNQTTGSFNLRVQTPTPGAVVDLPSGTNAILFSDGENVYDATTYVQNVTTFPALTVTDRPSNVIFGLADRGSMNLFTGTFTQTFEALATLTSGWYVDIQNIGTGVITLDPNGSETFNTPTGARTTIKVYPGEGFRIVAAVGGFNLVGRSSVVQLGAAASPVGVTPLDMENGYTDTEFARIVTEFSNVTWSSSQMGIRVKKGGAYITSANYSIGITYSNGATAVSLTGLTSGLATGSTAVGSSTSGVLTVVRPTQSTGNQLIMCENATPSDSSPKNNMSVVGIAESTAAAIEGIRFLDSGGGGLTGQFVAHGYRG